MNAATKINWDLTARARVGYASDNWLLYATGGLVLLGAKTDLTGAFGVNPCVTISVSNGTPGLLTCSGTNKRVGATAGAGVEYGFTPNLSAKLEYRYIAAWDARFRENASSRADAARSHSSRRARRSGTDARWRNSLRPMRMD